MVCAKVKDSSGQWAKLCVCVSVYTVDMYRDASGKDHHGLVFGWYDEIDNATPPPYNTASVEFCNGLARCFGQQCKMMEFFFATRKNPEEINAI